MEMSQLHIRIPDVIRNKLERIADEEGAPVNYIINKALREWMKEKEET